MSSVALTAFEVFDLPVSTDGGVATPSSSGVVTGTGSVTVKPIAGESATNMGVYSVSTPIAGAEALTMASGTIIIKSGGNQFELALTNGGARRVLGLVRHEEQPALGEPDGRRRGGHDRAHPARPCLRPGHVQFDVRVRARPEGSGAVPLVALILASGGDGAPVRGRLQHRSLI